MELQDRLDELEAAGLGVAAISYDSVDILADFSRRRGITFPLLSDTGSATIDAFGIRNTVAAEAIGLSADNAELVAEVDRYVGFGIRDAVADRVGALAIGTPFPGTFVVDRAGRVTSRFFEAFYRERMTTSSILLKLGAGEPPVAATEVSTGHLTVTSYPSHPEISVGSHFSLALDVDPGSGMHVYAPGASGYRVIGLTIDPQPFVRLLPMEYPASEIYHFEPLDERVPVYQKPFTLLQDVFVEATPAAAAALRDQPTVTLNGSLEYQACDDRLCYDPVSVPLSWTVVLTPLDNQRAAPPQ